MTKALFWCLVLAMVLLGVWFIGFLLAGDLAYRVHVTMFNLSRHEFDVINYCGMALVKLVAILFFFVPWMALRLALREAQPAERCALI